MQRHSLPKITLRTSLTGLALLWIVALAGAQTKSTITATAEVKTAGGATASAPVTIVIDRFASDSDHAALVKAAKSGGTETVRHVLAKRSDVGSLTLGEHSAAVKYAHTRSLGDGQLITAITSDPLAFLSAGKPGAKPAPGYSLGLVLIELSGKGTGTGELVPAGMVRVGDQDSIITEAYNSADIVQLTNVVRK
jgi:hypothetical protein